MRILLGNYWRVWLRNCDEAGKHENRSLQCAVPFVRRMLRRRRRRKRCERWWSVNVRKPMSHRRRNYFLYFGAFFLELVSYISQFLLCAFLCCGFLSDLNSHLISAENSSDDRVRIFLYVTSLSSILQRWTSVFVVFVFWSCLSVRGVLGKLVPRELWETSGFWFSREFWDLFHLTSHRRCRIMWFVMPPSISDSFQICSHERFHCGGNLAALQAELQPWVRMHGRAADTELAFL